LANFVDSKSSKNIIVDLCSGSGVIPVIISAKKKYSKIFAVELQEEMFDILDRNIALNNLENKIVGIKEDVKNVKKIRSKIVEVSNVDKADIIVCNPPYKEIGTGCKNENDVKFIARHEVKCNLEDIFKTSSNLLKSKGKLYLVHKPERIVDLMAISRKYNLEAKNIRFVTPTYDSKPSIVLVEYVKDGKNECKILPNLIEYEKNEKGELIYTDEIYKIYGMNK
jgi:tRNA1(Val) A37 N6-methylase TrmN6